MGVLTPAALRTRIASGNLDPVYLVLGDDEHEKRALAAALADTIDEGVRVFNLDRLHGGDAGLGDVLAAAQIVPVMAPRRIVIALRAERMLEPAKESAAARRALDAFEEYLNAPPVETTLVLVAGGLDERRRIAKQLRARATVVRCGVPEDAAGLQRWIRERVAAAGRKAEAAAIRLLSELVGRDAGRLRNAVERVLNVQPEFSTSGGTSDARFIKDYAEVAECGLVGRTMHKVDECIAVSDLDKLTKVYIAILEDFFATG